ncbi:MAG: hypothetical protein PHD76_10630 [Methylacidiphilales bacterium]|nr:hypothetical protein [Candidatus Methylacidiphilales bacterium]
MSNPKRLYLGWDIGGTKSSVGVGASEGAILGRASWPSRTDRGPDAMLQDFCDAVACLLAEQALHCWRTNYFQRNFPTPCRSKNWQKRLTHKNHSV